MTSLRAWCSATLLTLAAIGCKSAHVASTAPARVGPVDVTPETSRPNSNASTIARPSTTVTPVATVSFQETLPRPEDQPPPRAEGTIGDVLSREWLSAEVEALNPSLEAMIAAWQAAAQRYPQQIALDDPMLMGMIAPESAGSDVTETAYAFQLNQKLPWFGKRRLRGAAADANADAAFQDAEDSRLQVRLAADLAFIEYFLASRLIEVNRDNGRIMQQFRDSAQEKYRTNQVTQQDVLQADLELADLSRRRLELERMQLVAIARINTLLRRWPDAPLPPPPANLEPPHRPAEARQ